MGARGKKFALRRSLNRIFRIFEGCKSGNVPRGAYRAENPAGRGTPRAVNPGFRLVMRDMTDRNPVLPDPAAEDRAGAKRSERRGAEPAEPAAPAGSVQAGTSPEGASGSNPTTQPSRFPTVGDLLAMLGIAFVAQILVGIVGRLFLLGGSASELTPGQLGRMTAVVYFISMALTLGGVLYYRHVRGGRGRWAHFSLRGLNPTLLLWSFVLIFAVGVVLEPLLRVLPELTLSVGRGFWTMVSLILFAPVFEELLCRGVVLGSLRARYGVTIAWLVSALFFGVLHIQPVQVVSATVIGLILGYVYLSTDSLWSVMILHALNNAMAYLALVTGHANALLIDLVPNRTLYVVIYIVALALCAVSGWMMVRTLQRMKKSEKKPARA